MRTTHRIAAVALAVVLPLAACSKSDGGSSSSSDTTKPAASSSGSSTDAVEIKGFKFAPDALKVKVGATVTFTNNDTSTHTATSTDGPGEFDTGDTATGKSKTVKITKAGSYKYHCSIHNSMTGTIEAS